MSSTIAPLSTTTGSSTFAQDLQSSVNRALAIAALPIQKMTADQAQVNSKITELGQFGTLFSKLQSSLQTLSSGTGTSALSATVSDSSVIKATVTGSALPGTYTVHVLDPGSPSSSISATPPIPITDPSSQSISQSASFTLTVNGATFTLQPADLTLNALAASINSSGAPAQAVIVNLGNPQAADYHLIVQSTGLGDIPIQLNDGSN